MELAAQERKHRSKQLSPSRKRELKKITTTFEKRISGRKPLLQPFQIIEAQKAAKTLDLREFTQDLTENLLWKLSTQLKDEIVTINCAGWENISETCIRSISLAFGEKVETFDLSESGITNEGLKTLLLRLLAIRTLKLHKCRNLSNQCCRAIVEGCPDTLLNLDVSHCAQVDHRGIQWLGGSIGTLGVSCKVLQSISLAFCSNLKDIGLASLGAGCRQLRYINVGYCKAITDQGIIPLVKGCKALRLLNLQHCNLITDASLICLGQHCIELRSLNVASCIHISDKGLGGLVVHNHFLQALNVAGCKLISEDGVHKIVHKCKGLQMMNLSGCELVTQRGLSEMLRGLPFVELAQSFTGFMAKKGAQTLKLESQMLVIQDNASCKITAFVRGVATRRRLRLTAQRAHECTCALLLQKWWRGLQMRHYVQQLKQARLEQHQAILLQRNVRSWQAKQQLCYLREQRSIELAKAEFAIQIQKQFRGWFTRACFPYITRRIQYMRKAKHVEFQHRNAVRIQALIRRFLSNLAHGAYLEEYFHRKKDMKLAAIRIQKRIRIKLAKNALQRARECHRQKFATANAAAVKIQKRYRVRLAKQKFHVLLQARKQYQAFLHTQARDIQRIVRGRAGRVKARHLQKQHQVLMQAATRIQQNFRGHHVAPWQTLKRERMLQQIEANRAREESILRQNVHRRNQARLFELSRDSASEDEGEEETEDWGEYWDEEEQKTFYFSPSRGQRSWDKPIDRYFEKSIVGWKTRIYWIQEKTWFTGTLTRYHFKKNKHRIEYEDRDHEWLDLRKHEHRVQLFDPQEKSWSMFQHCRSYLLQREKQDSPSLLQNTTMTMEEPHPGLIEEGLPPSPWVQYMDTHSGTPYYHNPITDVTTWYLEETYND